MPNEINMYTPRHLAEVVRQREAAPGFFLDTFFTNIHPFPTERVDVDLVKGDRHMAAFVNPRRGAKVLTGQGYETKSYAAPLINPADITYADQLLQRLPGEDLYSGWTPAERAAQKLMEEYGRLDDAVGRREEWMAAQALVNGAIHVQGEGVEENIDFRLSEAHKPKLQDTAQWGKSAAKPLDDLGTWVGLISDNGFANADMAILGTNAAKAFTDDAKVLKLLDNRRVEMGEINPRNIPKGARYIGHIKTVDVDLDLYTYNGKYLDDWTDPQKPVLYTLMPVNGVIVIPSTAEYMRGYGANTFLDKVTEVWVSSMAPRVLRSYIKNGPDRRYIEIMSRPLPVPDKVDSWVTATVM